MGDESHFPRDRSQLKELQSRVEELEMRNIKLEELLKTHVFADVNHTPQDVHNDLKNGIFLDGEKEWNARFGAQNSTCIEEQKLNLLSFNPVNQTNYSGQTFIGSQNTVAPACNTFIQTSTPAFVQNNQNTLVQNNTNLIQPINLVNIAGAHGSTNGTNTNGLSQQLNMSRGGFLLLPDGRISYFPQLNANSCSGTSSSLTNVENVLTEKATDNAPKFFILPANQTHAPIIHHHQSHIASPPPVVVVAENSLKRQRPLRPKPPLSLVTPVLLTTHTQQIHHENTDEALSHATSILLSPSSSHTQTAADMSPSNIVNFDNFFPEEHTLDEETMPICADDGFKPRRTRQAKGLRSGHSGKNLRRRGRPPKTMKAPDTPESLCPCKAEVLRECFRLDFSKDLYDISCISIPDERVHIEKLNADLNFQRFQHLFYNNFLSQYYLNMSRSLHFDDNKNSNDAISGSDPMINNMNTVNNFNSNLSDGYSYANSQSALVMIEEIQRDLLDSLSSASIPHSEKSVVSIDSSPSFPSSSLPLVDSLWSSSEQDEKVYQTVDSPSTEELTLSPFKSCIESGNSPISDLKCFKSDLFQDVSLQASEIAESLYNENFRRRLDLIENSPIDSVGFCSDRLVVDDNAFNHVAFVNAFKDNSISSSSDTILSNSFLQDTNSSSSSVNDHLLTHGFTSDTFGVSMDFGS